MLRAEEHGDAEDEEFGDRPPRAVVHSRVAEAAEAPQVGRDVVGNPGRESRDGGAERDRRAARISTSDPLSREVQPDHERADQQGQEEDAVVPHADAGGQTEEGPVVPAARARAPTPTLPRKRGRETFPHCGGGKYQTDGEQEAEGDEQEDQRVDPRPHPVADGVQRKDGGDGGHQDTPTLPSPARGGG